MARMLYLRDIDVDVHVRCCACGHSGMLPRTMLERRFGPNYPVLSIAPHYRCSRCDSRDTETRPAADPVPANQSAEIADDPSFDGPLAALRGLLDAARGRPDAEDEDEEETVPPAFRSSPLSTPEPARPAPPPSAVSLADLAADPEPDPDGPLPWEPRSRAEPPVSNIVPVEDGGAGGEEPEAWRWDDQPDSAPPPAPAGRSEDAGLDETLVAMRRFFSQQEEPEEYQDENRDEQEEEIVPAAFSARTLARTDFEDDAGDQEPEDTEDDEDPSNEEILAFAIRDPERPRPEPAKPFEPPPGPRAAPQPAPPPVAQFSNRMVRGSDGKDFEDHDASLEKTLAALRSMIEEAAADPDPATETDPPRPRPAAAVADWDDDDEPAYYPARPAPPDEYRDDETRDGEERGHGEHNRPDRHIADRGQGRGTEDHEEEEAPQSHRSAQELEVERAMLALRQLVETDEPSPDRHRQRPAAASAPRPASRPAPSPVDHLVDDEELRQISGDARSPEPLIEPIDQVPTPSRRGGRAGEPSALEKTISALRGMLELDGKHKR